MNAFSKSVAALGLSAGTALCPCCSTTARAEAPIAAETASTNTETLTVEGMTCASCSVAVRTALKKLEGVKKAQVTAADKRAVVDYEPAKVTPQQLIEAVTKLGYRVTVRQGS